MADTPMNQQTITVTDTETNICVPDGVLAHSDNKTNEADWRVNKQTLHGGCQEGVELIEVDNGKIKFTVIPTRGMSILRVACNDVELGWNSPIQQIVHPMFINLNDQGGLGWLAGFNEMMVRCGLEFAGHPGEDNGTMLSLHGRIGNIPASKVSVVLNKEAPHRIRIRGLVEEKRFKFGVFELWTEVSTVPGSTTLEIKDHLVNKSEYEQEYQIIYHTNFGRPILGKGARFVAAAKSVAPFDEYAAKDLNRFPIYLGPTKDYGEQVYCLVMNADHSGQTIAMLHNSDANSGVAIQYHVDSLPYFTLWKNTDLESDGYVTGLEPGSGFPYNRSIERQQGRVPKLGPGDAIDFDLKISALEDASAVSSTMADIAKIQGECETILSSTSPIPQMR